MELEDNFIFLMEYVPNDVVLNVVDVRRNSPKVNRKRPINLEGFEVSYLLL